MPFLRAVLNFVVGGALAGVLLTTFFAPRYFAWDNTPAFGKALCDCADTTRQTAERLISAQMMGCGVGAGVGLVGGVVFAMLRRKKARAALTPPAATT